MRFGRNTHQKVRELLSAYMDGELSPQEKALVEGHLRECADCRRELETLRRTVAILRDAPRLALPRSFVIRRADVEKAPAALSRAPAFLRVVAALGAAAFVLVVGVYFLLRMLLPAAPVPLAQAPSPERAYKAVAEETPVVTVEPKKVVTREVAREIASPAPEVGNRRVPEVPAPELGVETEAISPIPTPTPAPVGIAPYEKPLPESKPAASPTSTSAPGPKSTTVLALKPTPTPTPSFREAAKGGLMWMVAFLLLAAGIAVWLYRWSRS